MTTPVKQATLRAPKEEQRPAPLTEKDLMSLVEFFNEAQVHVSPDHDPYVTTYITSLASPALYV